jgi:parvulin-like peptidyl-prolyl isomerase
VRRVLVLVVIAAAVCVGAGLAIPSNAVTVNGDALSHTQLNDELSAINASRSWQCYLQAQAYLDSLASPTPVEGVTMPTWNSTAATEWANSRAQDLAIVGYVRDVAPHALSPANVAAAGASLEQAITSTLEQAYQRTGTGGQGFSCTGAAEGTTTLASMPMWFQMDQRTAEAAKLALQQLIPSPLPTEGAALESWFNEHAAEFATTCLSLIVTASPEEAEIAAQSIAAGHSFADVAKQYSVDPSSAPKGGAIGCVPPTSSSFPTVLHYVGSLATNHVSQVFAIPNQQGGSDYYLFTVTKRTPNSFEKIHTTVAELNAASNAGVAEQLGEEVQERAGITVSPALGAWLLTSSGGTIVPPTAPPASSILNVTANTPVL